MCLKLTSVIIKHNPLVLVLQDLMSNSFAFTLSTTHKITGFRYSYSKGSSKPPNLLFFLLKTPTFKTYILS